MEKSWRVNYSSELNYDKKITFSRNRQWKIMEIQSMGPNWNLSKVKPPSAGNAGAGFSAPTVPLQIRYYSIVTPANIDIATNYL